MRNRIGGTAENIREIMKIIILIGRTHKPVTAIREAP